MNKYHIVVSQIIDLLRKNNYWFATLEHEPVKTSEEAAKVRPGYSLSQGAKALIVRIKKTESEKSFVMIVIPGGVRFDVDKVKKLYHAKDVRFATCEEVSIITGGIESGGVPPLGNLFHLEVVVDPTLFKNDRILFNAGDRRFSVAMKSADYKKIVNPNIVDIV